MTASPIKTDEPLVSTAKTFEEHQEEERKWKERIERHRKQEEEVQKRITEKGLDSQRAQKPDFPTVPVGRNDVGREYPTVYTGRRIGMTCGIF